MNSIQHLACMRGAVISSGLVLSVPLQDLSRAKELAAATIANLRRKRTIPRKLLRQPFNR